MSRMLRKNDCVPAGTLVQVIAGDVPSPGAAPSAAWLNLTGIWPPSGKPAMLIVIGGAAGAGAAPRCCAARGEMADNVMINPANPARMLHPPAMVATLRYTKSPGFLGAT